MKLVRKWYFLLFLETKIRVQFRWCHFQGYRKLSLQFRSLERYNYSYKLWYLVGHLRLLKLITVYSKIPVVHHHAPTSLEYISLPFSVPQAYKKHPFWVKPPCIAHYRECPGPPPLGIGTRVMQCNACSAREHRCNGYHTSHSSAARIVQHEDNWGRVRVTGAFQ